MQSDDLRTYNWIATLSKFGIYAALYASPFIAAHRVLRPVQHIGTALSLAAPVIIVLCAALLWWSTHRANAIQHALNVKIERM